ncbi:MAG: hypothetical protein R3224_03840 [Balneolaceae bacterium]|nr:hypothetical protein [Balneolaceae bacterium]
MNFFRTHTARIVLACLIWSGITLYLVQPVEARTSSNSFTSWLETVVKKDHAGDIQQQIFKLKESEGSLATLIEKASEMVSRNNDEFNLPIEAHSSDAHRVYHLLIAQWNSFQTGNGMGKAPLPDSVKPIVYPPADKFVHTGESDPDIREGADSSLLTGHVADQNRPPSHLIEPLSGGTAIGAP